MEEWRAICDGIYAVSSLGRVKRLIGGSGATPGHILRATPQSSGYLTVTLGLRGRRLNRPVHLIVAETFLGPCPPGQEVNHVNGRKPDNRASNLEHLSKLENIRHGCRLGLHVRGERVNTAKLRERQVRHARRLHAQGETCHALSRRFGVTWHTMRALLTRRTWRHLI